MIRSGKLLMGLGIWLALAGTSGAFSLLGPFPAWQLAAYDGLQLDYNAPNDIGGPMRPDEGYRWNIPVIYYAFDQSFVNYFGTEGMRAVNQAIAVFNNLPPMTQITSDGFSFFIRGEIVPTRTTLVNGQAAALGLLDLKSVTMHVLIEQLGLAEPERYAWALRSRDVVNVPNQTDITNYTVVNLNFDPITLRPTNMVNDVLYGYDIVERNPPVRPDFAEAFESSDDLSIFSDQSVAGGLSVLTSLSSSFSAVGGANSNIFIIQSIAGRLFTGLTHDDVGGLRWLYHANNFAVENLETNVALGPPLAAARNSPWVPFFGGTNVISTNVLINTNLLVVEGLRAGINKIQFQRVNYDSIVGRTFTPITNRFIDRFITNRHVMAQSVQRVINRPDIIFTAEDLGLFDNFFPNLLRRSGTQNWQNNDAINGRDTLVDGGPGVIQGPVFIEFSNHLPFFFNSTSGGVIPNETTQFQSVGWGSFDEGTLDPIIYPQYGPITLQRLRQFVVGGGN